MPAEQLIIEAPVKLDDAFMLLGFTGWMDGGDVSTGTIDLLVQTLGAVRTASIDPDDFYILNFPGSMEISSLFRPHVKIEDGVIKSHRLPENVFHCHEPTKTVLFNGKEPNVHWRDFADCVFKLASQTGVKRLYFVGSVAGAVPHTRQPCLFSSVSDAPLLEEMERFGLRPSSYEGPSSIITYLMALAPDRGFEMATVVAEIPAYIQGTNPKCIEAVTRKLAAMLELPLAFDSLRQASDQWEKKLNEALAADDKEELTEHIHKLEEDYDNELFDTEMGDLKDWLEQRGIRLD